MVCTKTEKQKKSKAQSFKNSSKIGPLLVLMSIFINPAASAEVLRLVRWPDGVFCPTCGESQYVKNVASIRNTCKDTIVKKCKKIIQRQDWNDSTLQAYRIGTVADVYLGIFRRSGQWHVDKLSVS